MHASTLLSTAIMALSATAANASPIAPRASSSTYILTAVTNGATATYTDQLSYYQGGLYTGSGPRSESASEPLILSSGFAFTSYHSSPTGWQNMYVTDKTSLSHLGFTTPHSGSVPDGATTQGWAFTDDGFLSFEGHTDRFFTCLMNAAPGGTSIQYAPEGYDPKALSGAGCNSVQLKATAYGFISE
jgi:hypothetical protein